MHQKSPMQRELEVMEEQLNAALSDLPREMAPMLTLLDHSTKSLIKASAKSLTEIEEFERSVNTEIDSAVIDFLS